jgi:FkbM family methyltransferase
MISFSQNGEDVVLRRTFSQQPEGFYIDVGACHAEEDSVTKYFYDLGWRGINIEPDRVHFDALVAARPRDVNINAAVGLRGGVASLFPATVRGHSTMNAGVARGRNVLAPQPVQVLTLDDVVSVYASDTVIDFLKIDVEGSEADVLASLNFVRVRPRVLIIEAVDALGQETHGEWEATVVAGGYRFALFDGLNRFYCREEDALELLPRLSVPANVLDNYRLMREVRAQRELAERADQFCVLLESERLSAQAQLSECQLLFEGRLAAQRSEHDVLLASARREAELVLNSERAAAQAQLSECHRLFEGRLAEQRSEADALLASVRREADLVLNAERAAAKARDAEQQRITQECLSAERLVFDAKLNQEREIFAERLRRAVAAERLLKDQQRLEMEASLKRAIAEADALFIVEREKFKLELSNIQTLLEYSRHHAIFGWQRGDALQQELSSLQSTASWRFTRPFRQARKFLSLFFSTKL